MPNCSAIPQQRTVARVFVRGLVALVAAIALSTGSKLLLGQENAPIPVYAVQGSDASSPLLGERVDVFGLVTAVVTDGFFLQDPLGDGDPATSDGLFVYTRSAPTVLPGECVVVRSALVEEFYAKTELTRAASIAPATLCAATTIAPAALPTPRLNGDRAAIYEPLEGMLVRVENFRGVVHGPTRRFEGGDVEIAFVPAALNAYLDGGRIFHDEADEIPTLLFLSNGLGATLPEADHGDTLSAEALTGILDYNFGKYQLALLPESRIEVERGAQRPPAAIGPASEDDFTLCSFNLHGMGRGTAQYPDETEYARQLQRRALVIAEALHGCTLVALQELGTPADAVALADALKEGFGLDYAAVALEGPGSANAEFPLTNGLLARRDRVRILNAELRQTCTERRFDVPEKPDDCPTGRYLLFERPPLVVDVEIEGAWGDPYPLTIINNHWKSLAGDADENAARRSLEVRFVASLVQAELRANPNAHIAVIGDLNDFYGGVPIRALQASVQPPLVHTFDFVPALERYTYIFDGASQVLDQALVTPSLARTLAGVAAVHINADYAEPASDRGDRFTSDHDPIWLRLRPAGAASVGGALGFPGVTVVLLDAKEAEAARAVTDDQGEFRILGLEPGRYALRLETPPSIAPPAERLPPLDLRSGYQELSGITLRHRVTTAGVSAIRSLSP